MFEKSIKYYSIISMVYIYSKMEDLSRSFSNIRNFFLFLTAID